MSFERAERKELHYFDVFTFESFADAQVHTVPCLREHRLEMFFLSLRN